MLLTYAIGDVHGRRDLLSKPCWRRSAAMRPVRAALRIIFLGDLIDRGPESRLCLDLVIENACRVHPGSRLILGNHEEFLLVFVESAGTESARPPRAAGWPMAASPR
jgi:serine/threonine protein phosphatase 1